MEILLLLYLAHFLGDYPLQTDWVYAQKMKGWGGGLFHAGGIFSALLVCLAPFLYVPEIWMVILITGVVHYLQDNLKRIWERNYSYKAVGYFLDQFFHILSALLLWWLLVFDRKFIPYFEVEVYENIPFVLFCIGLILVTYGWSITGFVLSESKAYPLRFKSMCRNAVIYALFFWGFFFLFR